MSDKTAGETNRSESALVVASVLSSDRVVLNHGTDRGVREGQRYLVYELSDEEITDPASGESLGRLEIPKGTGIVVHVQKSMATLESDRDLTRGQERSVAAGITELMSPGRMAPFRSPNVGDPAKRLY